MPRNRLLRSHCMSSVKTQKDVGHLTWTLTVVHMQTLISTMQRSFPRGHWDVALAQPSWGLGPHTTPDFIRRCSWTQKHNFRVGSISSFRVAKVRNFWPGDICFSFKWSAKSPLAGLCSSCLLRAEMAGYHPRESSYDLGVFNQGLG